MFFCPFLYDLSLVHRTGLVKSNQTFSWILILASFGMGIKLEDQVLCRPNSFCWEERSDQSFLHELSNFKKKKKKKAAMSFFFFFKRKTLFIVYLPFILWLDKNTINLN